MFARPLAATTNSATATAIPSERDVDAHLSEGIPRFWLLDNTALETFVDNELRFGLQVAVEAKVLADINGTSGIQTQPYATSVLATLRKGLTKLETAGYAAGSIVLHPTDWEGVELALSSTNAIEHLSLPYDPASRRLFGVPIVATVSEAAGVGNVLAGGGRHRQPGCRGVVVGELQRRRLQQEPHPSAVRGQVRDLGAVPAGCRLLRPDRLSW